MTKKAGASIHWKGLDKKIMSAAINLGNTNELLKNIGEALVSGTIDRFDKGESPEGKAWQQSKRAKVEGGKTLLDTGKLRSSVSYQVTGSHSVKVGSISKYALIHQKGGEITPKKARKLYFKGANGKLVQTDKVTMPPRPFIGISKDDKEEIANAIGDFMLGAFK